MTAETLKPFIPLPNGATYTKKSRRRIFDIITICFVAILSLVSLTLLALLIWNSMRITQLETEIDSLKISLNDLRERHNFDYDGDMNNFEDSYKHILGQSGTSDDNLLDLLEDEYDEGDLDVLGSGDYGDDEDESDEDEEGDDDYLGYIKEDSNIKSTEEESDNLYEDIGKFWKYKKQRKQRSINAQSNQEMGNSNSFSNGELNNGEDKNLKLKFIKSTKKTYFDKPESLPNRKETELHHSSGKKTPKKHNLKKINAGKKYIKNSDLIKATQYTLNLFNPRNQDYKEENNTSIFFGHAQTTGSMDIEKIFNSEKGYLRILEDGLYFIYAQINYNNEHFSNGYSIYKNFRPFLHCMRGVQNTSESLPLENTCYTSGITHLTQGDIIYLKDIYSDRTFKEGEYDSFFGIIRLGESNK